MNTDVKQHLASLRASDPALQREYERLGPRYEAISALIRARQRARLTQRELAERMGVSQSVVARLESAEHSPRLDTLAEAARALDCELDVRFVKRRTRTS